MALQLRRGTDAERQLVTFVEGELVYTTDTRELYIGDGATQGGIRLTGDMEAFVPILKSDLDLDGFTIGGEGNINVAGNIAGSSITGDLTGSVLNSSQVKIVDITNNTFTGSLVGSVLNSSQETLVNASTGVFTGTFVGDGSGLTNLPGGGGGIVEGQTYNISIVSDDSSIMVDAVTGIVNANVNNGLTVSDRFEGRMITLDGAEGGILINTTGTINDSYDLITINSVHNDSTVGSGVGYVRARGTTAVPESVQTGDIIISQIHAGVTINNGFGISAKLDSLVDGVVNENIAPGAMHLATQRSDGEYNRVVLLDSKGNTRVQELHLGRMSSNNDQAFVSLMRTIPFNNVIDSNTPVDGPDYVVTVVSTTLERYTSGGEILLAFNDAATRFLIKKFLFHNNGTETFAVTEIGSSGEASLFASCIVTVVDDVLTVQVKVPTSSKSNLVFQVNGQITFNGNPLGVFVSGF